MKSVSAISVSDTSQTQREEYLTHLSRGLPMLTYGFHLDVKLADEKTEYCYCPCDRVRPRDCTVTTRWRKLCDIDALLRPFQCAKTRSLGLQKSPNGYLDHVKTKGETCPYHRMLHSLLKVIY